MNKRILAIICVTIFALSMLASINVSAGTSYSYGQGSPPPSNENTEPIPDIFTKISEIFDSIITSLSNLFS